MPGHQAVLYKNFNTLNPMAVEGRLTNQVAKKVGNAHFFTFCQLVYYSNGGNIAQKGDRSIAANSKCGDPGHFDPR